MRCITDNNLMPFIRNELKGNSENDNIEARSEICYCLLEIMFILGVLLYRREYYQNENKFDKDTHCVSNSSSSSYEESTEMSLLLNIFKIL